ncbi:MAG: FAD-dependent thymidylate synthase [Thermoplasmatales archaeon]
MGEFSNRDKDVFLINCEKMVDRGALMSRYSRTRELDIRNLWDKEFKNDATRGESFYERVFVEYGDESVAELVTAQMGIQNVSNVLSKVIEEGRIGLSYLEKSSRYVSYKEKRNGRYLYLDAELTGIPKRYYSSYQELSDSLFDLYVETVDRVTNYIKEEIPIEKTLFRLPDGSEISYSSGNISDSAMRKAYESSVRSRALDEARFLLPSSTLTNLGISGNARGFSRMLERLRVSGLKEADKLYYDVLSELKSVFPKLIDNVESPHGKENIKYQIEMKELIPLSLNVNKNNDAGLKLISCEDETIAINKILTAFMFERGENTILDIMESISKISTEDKANAIRKIISLRKNRRQKLDRSFEHTSYTFQIIINFGAFRDLQRHRIVTLQRQKISTEYGYDIPPIIARIEDLREKYMTVMNSANELYRQISKEDKTGAQYVVPFAYRYPVLLTANLRELVYLTELRSTPQAHFDLRNLSRDIVNQIRNAHPTLSYAFKFVNTKEEELGRLSAELRKEMKKESLNL